MNSNSARKVLEDFIITTYTSLQETCQLAHDNCHSAIALHTRVLSHLSQLLPLHHSLTAQYIASLTDSSIRLQTIQELSMNSSISPEIQQTAQYTLETLATIETLHQRENAIQQQRPKIKYAPHSFTSLVTHVFTAHKETHNETRKEEAYKNTNSMNIDYTPNQDKEIIIPINQELLDLALENLYELITKTIQPHSTIKIVQNSLEQNERTYALCTITYPSIFTSDLLQQLNRIQRIPPDQYTELLHHAAVSYYIIKECHNGRIKYKSRSENITSIELIL